MLPGLDVAILSCFVFPVFECNWKSLESMLVFNLSCFCKVEFGFTLSELERGTFQLMTPKSVAQVWRPALCAHSFSFLVGGDQCGANLNG